MKQVILIGHNLLENNTYVSAFYTPYNTQDCCNLEKSVNILSFFFFPLHFSLPFSTSLCSWQYSVDQQPHCFLLITPL